MGWVGLVYNMLWVGLGWVCTLVDWVGLGFKKLTHVHVCVMDDSFKKNLKEV